MKAAIRRKYGSPSQINIESVTKPTTNEGEALIRVYATTVNRTDCANLTAQPFIMRFFLGLFKPRKMILGTDFAGEIVAMGKNGSTFKVGDKVFGFIDMEAQSQAEYITLPSNALFLFPENLDYKDAAASLEGAHYAYTFIHKVKLNAGQSVLINGATGAIGSALLQFVRQYKVKITATCSTKNMSLIQGLGADKVIDYTKEEFTNVNEEYDFIFDAVGKSSFGKCKPILTKKGVYISSELGAFAQNIFYALFTQITRKKVIFPIPYKTKKTIPFISKLLAERKFKPVIDREYDLKDIAYAYEYVLTGQKTGNVVIKI